MEDSGLISKEKFKVESVSLSELFEEQCPIYMSYGMSYDEFWNDSPYRAMFYRKAKQISTKQKNEELWLQGAYVYDAISRLVPVLHAFAKSGTKPLPYLDKPFDLGGIDNLNKNSEEDEEKRQQKIRNERLIAQVHFEAWARATAKHFENKS